MVTRQPLEPETESFAGLLLRHRGRTGLTQRDLAERLGLPVDAGRIGAYGPNVTVLRDFVRSSRQPL